MTDRTTTGGDQIETERDARATGLSEAEIWLKKIKLACDEEKDWRKEAQTAVEVYEADDKANTSFNIFHSNVETLLPALYNSTPVPDVRRRYGDADPVAKLVVDMTERCLSYMVDQYPFDETMKDCVREALVPGRGVIRVRYEADVEGDTKGYEAATCEHVPYDKFVRGPGRKWEDVPWIAFEHDLTRDDLTALAGKAAADIEVKHDARDNDDKPNEKGVFRTTCVYEIWDKRRREVLFLVKDDKKIIKREPDPLQLTGFFCVPPPLQQVKRVSSLTPVTPYRVYRALIEELDAVTKRIRKLVSQLKVRGLVSAEVAKDMDAMRSLEDGQYMAASEAASFISGGGKLENAIAHMPMDPTVAALQQLYVQREQIKQTIYEVTGLSDILRGASDATETATAQQIKTQWGSLRVQNLQREVQRVARDLFRMKTEIMARHYDPARLLQMSNLADKEPQLLQAGIQLFKSGLRGFRVDVETDSTIRADLTRNQEQMTQFLMGTGQFADGMAKIVPLMPQLLPTVVEVYTAFARNFSLGKQAEDALDSLGQRAPQMAQQAEEQQQQNPEQKKLEMQMQADQQKFELEKQKLGMDLEMKKADLQIKQAELEMKREGMQLELEAKAADVQVKRQTAEMDMQARQYEMDFSRQKGETELGMMRQKGEMEMGQKRALAEMDIVHKSESDRIAMAAKTRETGLAPAEGGSVEVRDPYKEALSGLMEQLAEIMASTQQQAQMMAQQNAEAMAAMQQTLALVQQSAASAGKPKRMKIVRGPDGKAIGAEVA